jgi:two-component system OmpR family response regulator
VRVLVVDDYAPIADLVAALLCNHGYDARAAYSANEALRAMDDFKPQAVVLDVILADVDGFGFAAKFAQRFPWSKVLLTSAWDFQQDPVEDLKACRIVRKSALMEELFPFLDSCTAPEEAQAVEGRSDNLAVDENP